MTEKPGHANLPPEVRVPRHSWFYTIDQVASLLAVSEGWLEKRLHYIGRSLAGRPHLMQVVNIAQPEEDPRWRISEDEFARWLRRQGVKLKHLK